MEQLTNSTELNLIFEIIIHKYRIGLMIDGKLVWLQEEDPNEDISIALINSLTFIMLDAHSIFTLLSIWIGTWRSKVKQKTDGVLLAC